MREVVGPFYRSMTAEYVRTGVGKRYHQFYCLVMPSGKKRNNGETCRQIMDQCFYNLLI